MAPPGRAAGQRERPRGAQSPDKKYYKSKSYHVAGETVEFSSAQVGGSWTTTENEG
jgi:hypothetical protein